MVLECKRQYDIVVPLGTSKLFNLSYLLEAGTHLRLPAIAITSHIRVKDNDEEDVLIKKCSE